MAPFPVTEEILCQFVASVAAHGVVYNSLKAFISALCFFQISQFGKDPSVNEMCTLQYVLIDIKGVNPSQQETRQGLTFPSSQWYWENCIVNGILNHQLIITQCYGRHLAFTNMFLRAGEASVPSLNFLYIIQTLTHTRGRKHRLNSITKIYLLADYCSKNRPISCGSTYIHGQNLMSPLPSCSSSFIYWETGKGEGHPGPLFRFEDKCPLRRDTFVREVRQALKTIGYNEAKYAGHSFRIGVTTTVAAVGVEDSLIKSLRRWQSTTYLPYVKIPRETLTAWLVQ